MKFELEVVVNLDDEDATAPDQWGDQDDEELRDVVHDAAKQAVCSVTGAPAGFVTVNVTGGVA